MINAEPCTDISVAYRAKKYLSSHSHLRMQNLFADAGRKKKGFQVRTKTVCQKEFKRIGESEQIVEFEENVGKVIADYLKDYQELKENSLQPKSIDIQLSLIISTFQDLSKILPPLKAILEKISENLSTIKQYFLSSAPQVPSPSIVSKLKLLSEENVFLHKSNEQLKNELTLIKTTKVFDEYHYSIEKLLNELSFKNQCISRCYQEMNDLKLREIHLLKVLEKKNLSLYKSLTKDKQYASESNESSKKCSVYIPPLTLC